MRKLVNCQICDQEFIQKHPKHFNCSDVCRKIDFTRKDHQRALKSAEVTRKLNKDVKVHPFRAYADMNIPSNIFKREKPKDKNELRLEIISKTEQFLKTNKITVLPSSPNGKVPDIRIRDLVSYSDSHQFYYIEEEDDCKNYELLEI